MKPNNEIRPWFDDEQVEVEPELDDDEIIQLGNERRRGVVWMEDGVDLG